MLLLCCDEQNLLPSPTPSVRFEHVTIEDRLSDNRVNGLLHDSEGYMWFGSQDGLSRFDGYFVAAIVEDAEGNLWVGTQNGLSRFETATGSFTTYRHDPEDEGSLLHNVVRSLLVDREGVRCRKK